MSKVKSIYGLGLSLALVAQLTACGKGSSDNSAPPVLPPIQQALATTSTSERIPADILASILWKESGLSASASTTLYGGSNTALGPTLSETAMGLSRETLGLDDSLESSTIPVQMAAYGKWLRAGLDAQNLALPTDIIRPDDVYDWAWNIARLHYPDSSSPKNLQILFALELIETLNEGFIWQDPSSEERLELRKRTPKLEISSFSAPIQSNLQFDSRASEILAADYLQLTYYNESNMLNRPRRIEIIHCPFTVSACLGNQLDAKNPAPLQAHYLIPTDYTMLPRPVKVLPHSTPLRRLNEKGEVQNVTDAVVIMLVGNSGRYINGERTQVNPSWYTKEQLSDLGKVIIGLCQALPRENPAFSAADCSTIGKGIVFMDANRHQNFQLGDIPDFEASIFESLVLNPGNINGAVNAALPGNARTFAAGASVPVEFTFIKGTARLEVQKLERCSSGKTVWVAKATEQLRGVDRKTIDIVLYDDGPNNNGQQFIRAMAYAADGSFMNWSNIDYFLTGYEKNVVFSNSPACAG